ncbi:L,D-transpeptidase [Pseudonocardia sp. HH130630-07]|uniref:L,D-transpeptidase n=1 Tax=Pseudonocardia sp. HH130630-07 TaxID=1690815 RepID=UPI0008150542|nr:L,D-transpeptidase [Pseudonocardia sp. HH130630-07]ANY06093.1 hypothetical protein AFB00_07030 [Pseudonocardia sp. HH130630-07]
MTREIGGRRRRSRAVTVLTTVLVLLCGALVAALAGTASAQPPDDRDGGRDRESSESSERRDDAEGSGARAEGRTEGTPCSREARACVDRAGRKAWLIRDGVIEAGPVPAAPGGPGQATPLGDFSVQWKHQDHRSAEFNNAPMPFAVFFAPGGIAFHEGNVNSPSAGCVRLDRANAERWFGALQVGDRVEVRE